MAKLYNTGEKRYCDVCGRRTVYWTYDAKWERIVCQERWKCRK